MNPFFRAIFLALILILTLTAGVVFARGGGGCVEQGVMIETPDGPRAIESLAVGEGVWSWREGRRVEARVLACYRVEPESFIDITLPGATLHVTGEHPIATAPGEFRQARYFHAGDHAMLWRGGALVDAEVEAVAVRRADKPAFNLSVYPGGQFVADGVLVHNKGGGCFLPHTPVLMSDGSTRPIGDVKPGDHVLALSPDEQVVAAEVKRVFTLVADEYWVIQTERGSVEVTGEHPFYVGHGQFRTAESLRVGDAVFSRDGPGISLQRVQSLRLVFRDVTVVNLQTDEPHTFFAAGFAVHNKGGGGGGCFPTGTRISTPRGDVPIERIAPGDVVTAVDDSGRRVDVKVASLLVQRDFLLTLTTVAGVLVTTNEHPLCVGPGRFVAAGELPIGAVIQRHDGTSFTPARVIAKSLGDDLVTVYNLSVDSPHTFIVDGFVVHNKGGGGGGGFSFGSGRSSSSGRSSTQPFDVGCFIYLAFFLGVPLISALWKHINSDVRRSGTSSGVSRGVFKTNSGNLDQIVGVNEVVKKSEPTERLLATLAKSDASFAKEQLKAAVVEAFTTLQLCWTRREYGQMRPLVTKEIAQQHEKQIASMIRQHEINRIENIQILRTDFVHVIATQSPRQKQVTVLIMAQSSDYYVDDRTETFRRGNRMPEPFQEFWTFTWDNNRWLLAEIEQVRESDALRDKNIVAGYDAESAAIAETSAVTGAATNAGKLSQMLMRLSASDPLWRGGELASTARSAFIKVMTAREAGDEREITPRDFTPALVVQLTKEIAGAKMGRREVEYRNLCVRKVQLIHADEGLSGKPAEFTARIVAHAQTVVREGGNVTSEDPYVATFTEYYTFVRLSGAWRASEIKTAAEMVTER